VLPAGEGAAELTGPDPLFELRAVTVRRPGATLLHEITATLGAASCTAVLGPSGAGKSTLLRLLNRFERPDSGWLGFHGRRIADYDVLALRRRVGLVAQRPVLLAGTVAADVRTGRAELTDDEVVALLDRVGLPAAFLDRGTDGLSGGEAQRVCLARALAVQPEVLLLDEPASSLDPEAVAVVEEAVSGLIRAGQTVVLVSHDAAAARRLATAALVLREGRLVESGPIATLRYLGSAP
jgi:putative ABC transport system ATP-binding protein